MTEGLPAARFRRRLEPSADNQRDEEQSQKDEQQNLSDVREIVGEVPEAQDTGNNREDRKSKSPVNYGMYHLSGSKRRLTKGPSVSTVGERYSTVQARKKPGSNRRHDSRTSMPREGSAGPQATRADCRRHALSAARRAAGGVFQRLPVRFRGRGVCPADSVPDGGGRPRWLGGRPTAI